MFGLYIKKYKFFSGHLFNNLAQLLNNSICTLELSCPVSTIRNLTTPLTRLQQKNSPYSIRVRAIDYPANNLVKVALPAFLSVVILLAFWNLYNALPFFNNKRIMKIRRTEIKCWINEFGEKEEGIAKYSFGTRLKYLSVLKSIFHYAVHELEVLEKNPADRLKIPVQDSVANKKETKYYSLSELNKLLEYMKEYKHQRFNEYQLYYMLMYFLSQTGLRISETLALRWSDIEENKITIERQTRRSDNNLLLLTT
jgi:integrase